MLGHRQLANVVEQRGSPQGFELVGIEIQTLGQFDGVDPHPLQMIVRGMVFGFNSQGQRLDGPQVESGHFFHVALFVFQLAQVEPVRTIDHKHGRQRQQGSLPVHFLVHPAHHSGDGSTYKVIRKRPEIAFAPHREERDFLGERNRHCHRGCTQKE